MDKFGIMLLKSRVQKAATMNTMQIVWLKEQARILAQWKTKIVCNGLKNPEEQCKEKTAKRRCPIDLAMAIPLPENQMPKTTEAMIDSAKKMEQYMTDAIKDAKSKPVFRFVYSLYGAAESYDTILEHASEIVRYLDAINDFADEETKEDVTYKACENYDELRQMMYLIAVIARLA